MEGKRGGIEKMMDESDNSLWRSVGHVFPGFMLLGRGERAIAPADLWVGRIAVLLSWAAMPISMNHY